MAALRCAVLMNHQAPDLATLGSFEGELNQEETVRLSLTTAKSPRLQDMNDSNSRSFLRWYPDDSTQIHDSTKSQFLTILSPPSQAFPAASAILVKLSQSSPPSSLSHPSQALPVKSSQQSKLS
ncbi:hypothetical protein FHG87_022801 [Trinorchestia longiramus]|nr:hypothetical protein FHG87_022801 [Trinorchestia longiramus]